MSRVAARIGLAAVIASVSLIAGACAGGASSQPTASPETPASVASASAVSPSPSPTQSPDRTSSTTAARVVVLARSKAGAGEPWSMDSTGKWSAISTSKPPTALGRTADGIVMADGLELDRRPSGSLSAVGSVSVLKWPGAAGAPVVALDVSPAGKVAVIASDGNAGHYGVAAADGTVAAVTPAPIEPFAPLLAWLDDNRLMVLSTDKMQVSRLSVVDLAANRLGVSTALAGVHEFAVSGDRASCAASTEKAVYVGATSSVIAGKAPASILTLADGQVVWALALDGSGSEVFMLSGTEAADGTVGNVRELAYARRASAWAKVIDSAAPFSSATTQVWLP